MLINNNKRDLFSVLRLFVLCISISLMAVTPAQALAASNKLDFQNASAPSGSDLEISNHTGGLIAVSGDPGNCIASIIVSSAADSGAGTLREAITNICVGGTITFDGDKTITLASRLMIDKSLTIDGAGHKIIVSGESSPRVQVFMLTGTGTVNLNSLTITKGSASSGAGIYNSATLNLTNSTLSENFIPHDEVGGGAIYNATEGILTVANSTFVNNSTDRQGGAIFNMGVMTVVNSAFSGNSSGAGSGAVLSSGTATLKNVIIANTTQGNNCDLIELISASSTNNLADDDSCGGSFTNSNNIKLDSLLADNDGDTQTLALLSGSAAIDAGNNAACIASPVSGKDQRGVTRPSDACDIGAYEYVNPAVPEMDLKQGTTAIASAGSFDFGSRTHNTNTDKVFTIENNGNADLTFTTPITIGGTNSDQFSIQAPLAASPVAAAGSTAFTVRFTPSAIGVKTASISIVNNDSDENPYVLNITGSGCTSPITVTSAADDGAGSLRQAIANICAGGVITFDGDKSIPLESTLEIAKDLTIDGETHAISLSGQENVRVMYISSYAAVTLNHLMVTKGYTSLDGGGIFIQHGTVTVTNSDFSGNSAERGGSIFTNFGTLNVTDSSFHNNSAKGGAGIFNEGTFNVTNSTFSDNASINSGGAIINNSYGDSCTNPPTASIKSSTFTGNSGVAGGAIVNSNGVMEILSSTITNNTATGNMGGGIWSYNNNTTCTRVGNSIIAENVGFDLSADVTEYTYQRYYSLDYNLVGVADTNVDFNQEFNLAHDQTAVTNLLLGDPGDNGGSTYTIPLLPGSMALDAGSGCPATDQRGKSRVGACDTGAFESQGFNLTISGGDDQKAVISSAFAKPLKVTVASKVTPAEAVNGGEVSFTVPASGASAVLASNPVTIVSGAASVGAAANASVGAYTVNASTSGAAPAGVDFSLTNTYGPPTVTTTAASLLTATSATLNGTVNPSGDSASFSFEYGLDDSYGTTVDAVPHTVTGSENASVKADLTGLQPNTTYHFRVVGENSGGTSEGSDLSFTTLGTIVTSEIHDQSSGLTITEGTIGMSVHASALVTGTGGGPTLTGQVTFTSFENPACSGSGTTAGSIALDGAGLADPSNTLSVAYSGFSVKSTYAGDDNYAAGSSPCQALITPPVVLNSGVEFNASGKPLRNFQVVTVGLKKLLISFNRDVLNVPVTDQNYLNSVINPENYLLLNGNGDGFDDSPIVTTCQTKANPNGGNDLKITVNSVSYENGGGDGPFVATLNLNGGKSLPNGVYRIYVCGTTSITDPDGLFKLAGDGLTAGSDFIRNFGVDVVGSSKAKTLPDTGFAQGQLTNLPKQPSAKNYAAYAGLSLEIPSLKLKTSLVGVPATTAGWDVTWLGDSAGWLNGSAFPTWSGNSVITGHVWDANNQPGIFLNLKQLKYDDQIKIHAWGQIYTYAVRETRAVAPGSVDDVLRHEDSAWLTLVTCEDFNPRTTQYASRRLVRAILVSVGVEK